jgi:HEAT repeat protein
MVSEAEQYRVLRVRPGATHQELVHAYRVLAKAYHPDSAGGTGNAADFIRVSHAYHTLMRRHALPSPMAMRPRPPVWPSPKAPEPLRCGTDIFSLGRTLLFAAHHSERARAARDLGWTGKTAAFSFLRKAFLDDNEKVRIAAVRAAGSLKVLHAGRDLALLYSRSGAAVRREVLAAFMRIGAADGASAIVSLGLRDPDPTVRLAARSAWDALA